MTSIKCFETGLVYQTLSPVQSRISLDTQLGDNIKRRLTYAPTN